MFSNAQNTFMYNDETGEVFRHYQVMSSDKGFLKEEGFVKLKFTTYSKYKVGSSLYSPSGFSPKDLKALEKKLAKKTAKETKNN